MYVCKEKASSNRFICFFYYRLIMYASLRNSSISFTESCMNIGLRSFFKATYSYQHNIIKIINLTGMGWDGLGARGGAGTGCVKKLPELHERKL